MGTTGQATRTAPNPGHRALRLDRAVLEAAGRSHHVSAKALAHPALHVHLGNIAQWPSWSGLAAEAIAFALHANR